MGIDAELGFSPEGRGRPCRPSGLVSQRFMNPGLAPLALLLRPLGLDHLIGCDQRLWDADRPQWSTDCEIQDSRSCFFRPDHRRVASQEVPGKSPLTAAIQMLNSSPWARQETFTRVESGVGSGESGEKEIYNTFYVRFFSAPPIREALLRIQQIQYGYEGWPAEQKRRFDESVAAELLAGFGEWIVVSVGFRSNDPNEESDVRRFFQRQTAETLKNKAFLSTEQFSQVLIQAYFTRATKALGPSLFFPGKSRDAAGFGIEQDRDLRAVGCPGCEPAPARPLRGEGHDQQRPRGFLADSGPGGIESGATRNIRPPACLDGRSAGPSLPAGCGTGRAVCGAGKAPSGRRPAEAAEAQSQTALQSDPQLAKIDEFEIDLSKRIAGVQNLGSQPIQVLINPFEARKRGAFLRLGLRISPQRQFRRAQFLR